jgi:hypothetical protein
VVIREKLRKLGASSIDQVIVLNQAESNAQEDTYDSLELSAQEVIPEFHARESEHQEWKRKVLTGEIELEGTDTEAFTAQAGARPTIARHGTRMPPETAPVAGVHLSLAIGPSASQQLQTHFEPTRLSCSPIP